MKSFDGTMFGPGQPCFGCSPDHPAGFRLSFVEDGEDLVTHFTPGDSYQGPPGVLHGGLVLTLADELAAWTLIAKLGKFGFTARVAGNLRKPVRIGIDIEGRGTIMRSTSRIAEVKITLSQNGAETFEGDFVFALLDRAGAEKLMGRALPDDWLKYSR